MAKPQPERRWTVSQTQFHNVADILVQELQAAGIDARVELLYRVTVPDTGSYTPAAEIVAKSRVGVKRQRERIGER